jgi:cytochrome b
MSAEVQLALLRVWHAWVAGAFVVAYLTADEDTYSMHLFAGYAVLAAIVVRLVVGLLLPGSGMLRLPRPSLNGAKQWLMTRKGRNPLFAWLAAALLGSIGLAALFGALADSLLIFEDPHEAISELSLWVIFAHIAFVIFMYGGKKIWTRFKAMAFPSPSVKESAP